MDIRLPELSAHQIETLRKYGVEEQYTTSTCLVNFGDRDYDFYVILEGGICIKNADDPTNSVVEHGVNQFTGSSNILSNRASELSAETKTNTTVLRIKPEKLKKVISDHSDISDLLLKTFLLRQQGLLEEVEGGIKVLGKENAGSTYDLRDFMEKNSLWYNFIDVDKHEQARALLESFDLCEEDLPVLIDGKNNVAKNPTIEELAKYTGVIVDWDDKVFDVLVVGAGPGGLAASVYAASEGLSVITIDSKAPGGQAGKSSKIENYLGFPIGISGKDLATNGYVQAQKFGCQISIPHLVEKIEHTKNHYIITATNCQPIKAKTIVAATGAAYSKLPVEHLEKYEGAGVYYSATAMHATMCKNAEVGVVGGGNSAGQAALFLAKYAKKVYVIIRSKDLGAKMSDYLVRRIYAQENIEVLTASNVTALGGNTYMEWVEIYQGENKVDNKILYLFTFIGAKPCTDWIGDSIQTDSRGFIATGYTIENSAIDGSKGFATRKPYPFETSSPGFFAVGDVRSGSVKRVASAVGEGSIVISDIHKYLALESVYS